MGDSRYDLHECKFSKNVFCKKVECEKCGWFPPVSEKRRQRFVTATEVNGYYALGAKSEILGMILKNAGGTLQIEIPEKELTLVVPLEVRS